MTTSEGRVKTKIRKVLDDLKCYYVMPVTGGYGNSGVPDFMVCYAGRFIGIEAKTMGNKPTALQSKHLRDIVTCGGFGLVVDETNVDRLKSILLSTLSPVKAAKTGDFDHG